MSPQSNSCIISYDPGRTSQSINASIPRSLQANPLTHLADLDPLKSHPTLEHLSLKGPAENESPCPCALNEQYKEYILNTLRMKNLKSLDYVRLALPDLTERVAQLKVFAEGLVRSVAGESGGTTSSSSGGLGGIGRTGSDSIAAAMSTTEGEPATEPTKQLTAAWFREAAELGEVERAKSKDAFVVVGGGPAGTAAGSSGGSVAPAIGGALGAAVGNSLNGYSGDSGGMIDSGVLNNPFGFSPTSRRRREEAQDLLLAALKESKNVVRDVYELVEEEGIVGS